MAFVGAGQNKYTVFPLENYTFGNKSPKPEKEHSVEARFARLRKRYGSGLMTLPNFVFVVDLRLRVFFISVVYELRLPVRKKVLIDSWTAFSTERCRNSEFSLLQLISDLMLIISSFLSCHGHQKGQFFLASGHFCKCIG